jgi:hypothetical protein
MKEKLLYLLTHKLSVAVLPSVAFGLSCSSRSVSRVVRDLETSGLVRVERRLVSNAICGPVEPLYESNEEFDAAHLSYLLRSRWRGERKAEVFVSATRRCLNRHGGTSGKNRAVDTDHSAMQSWVFFSLSEKEQKRWVPEHALKALGYDFGGVPDGILRGYPPTKTILCEIGGASYDVETLTRRHAWSRRWTYRLY